MKRQPRMMINRPYDSSPSDPMTDGLTNGDPHPKRWRLMGENYSAARRALYAAKVQLG